MGYPPQRNGQKLFWLLLFLIQIACFGNSGNLDTEIERRFNQLKLQYETVDTVHLKSNYSKSIFNPKNSTDISSKEMFYEYWSNSNPRQYRGHTTVLASEDFAGHNVEFADNGEIWQYYQKDTSPFSYGEKRFEQNPDALENPLFSPVSFLGKNDDNCPAYVLSLKDVQDEAIWHKIISQAKRIETFNQKQGQFVVELPGSVLIGKKFVFHVYFGESPDFLPEKIAWVSEGEIFKLIEIQYQKVKLTNGQMHWPKKVHMLGIPYPNIITEKLDIEVEIFEINKELPLNIFDIDFSSAEIVWHNDLEIFIRQRGGFAPAKYLKSDGTLKLSANSGSNLPTKETKEHNYQQKVFDNNATIPEYQPEHLDDSVTSVAIGKRNSFFKIPFFFVILIPPIMILALSHIFLKRKETIKHA